MGAHPYWYFTRYEEDGALALEKLRNQISDDWTGWRMYNSKCLDDSIRRTSASPGHRVCGVINMAESIQDLDVVALLRDLPDEGLEKGQTGTVVLTHRKGEAFEVEFILHPEQAGSSVVATVHAQDVLKLKGMSFDQMPRECCA
jgi:hypothetical protein